MKVKWDIICLVSLTLTSIFLKYEALLFSARHPQSLISRKASTKKLSETIMVNNMMQSRSWIIRNKVNVFSITARMDKTKKKGLPKTAGEWQVYGRATSQPGKVKLGSKNETISPETIPILYCIKYWKELYSQWQTVQKRYISSYFRNLNYCPINLPLGVTKRIVQFYNVMHLAYFRYFLACNELSLYTSFPISKT